MTSITIPDCVTRIGGSAFNKCSSLSSITLGSSVIVIETDAFKGCNNIKAIHFKGVTPPSIEYVSLDSKVYSNATLYVPIGSLNNYKSDKVWGYFNNIVKE